MSEFLRFRVDKLIRDKLPAVMRAAGLRVVERRLETAEFIERLKAKLAEETIEVAAADSGEDLLGELADVAEVVLALAQAHGFTPADLEARRLAKREERGGFDGRIYNAAVEADQGCPALSYYLGRPDQYPPI